jgi:hypothetical protein
MGMTVQHPQTGLQPSMQSSTAIWKDSLDGQCCMPRRLCVLRDARGFKVALIVWSTGKFFDFEKLSKTCTETGRYMFFFSSWPQNMCVNFALHFLSTGGSAGWQYQRMCLPTKHSGPLFCSLTSYHDLNLIFCCRPIFDTGSSSSLQLLYLPQMVRSPQSLRNIVLQEHQGLEHKSSQ